MRRSLRALALTLALAGATSTASAQTPEQPDERLRFSGYAGVGLGGSQSTDASGTGVLVNADMDPSVFMGGRIGSAVHEWFAVGGELQVQLWRNSAMNAYNSRFDFDAYGKLRHRYEVGEHELEAFLIVPAGFTLATVRNGQTNPGPGFNVGAMVGAWIFLTEHYALSFEAGWIYHHSYHNFNGLGGPATVQFDDNQAVLLVGGAFH